jgi:nicotinamide riboside transporter PnuC
MCILLWAISGAITLSFALLSYLIVDFVRWWRISEDLSNKL